MKIKLQRGVNPNLRIDFAIAIGWVQAQWELEELGDFVLTSAKDGAHGATSQHKQNQPPEVPGEAVDIRSREHFLPREGRHNDRMARFARRLQNAGLRVVLHPDWMAGDPHLHVAAPQRLFEEAPD